MKNKKGFTLVELLAVIVILGIILLIAVPGVQTLITNTKMSSFESGVKLAISNVETSALTQYTDTGACYVDNNSIKKNLSTGSFEYNGYLVLSYDSTKSQYVVREAKFVDITNHFYIENSNLNEINAIKDTKKDKGGYTHTGYASTDSSYMNCITTQYDDNNNVTGTVYNGVTTNGTCTSGVATNLSPCSFY